MTLVEKAAETVKEFRRRRDTMFDAAWQLKPGYTTEVAERFYSEFGQKAARLLPDLVDLITAAESEHGLRCRRCRATTVRLTVRDWAVCLGCGAGDTAGQFTRCDSFCEDCEDAAVTDPAELRQLTDELRAKEKAYRDTLIPIENATAYKLTTFKDRWIEVQDPHGSTHAFGTLVNVSRKYACISTPGGGSQYYEVKQNRFICHPSANSRNSGPDGQRVIPVLMPTD